MVAIDDDDNAMVGVEQMTSNNLDEDDMHPPKN